MGSKVAWLGLVTQLGETPRLLSYIAIFTSIMGMVVGSKRVGHLTIFQIGSLHPITTVGLSLTIEYGPTTGSIPVKATRPVRKERRDI